MSSATPKSPANHGIPVAAEGDRVFRSASLGDRGYLPPFFLSSSAFFTMSAGDIF